MPKLNDMMSQRVAGFDYSAARPERLEEAEYTLATIALDITGSVAGFEAELLRCAREAVRACAKHARGANVLMRVIAFNTSVHELVGFTPLSALDPSAITLPPCEGSTALRDAVVAAASASNDYGKALWDNDFAVNAAMFLITDGDDNASRNTLAQAKAELDAGKKAEWLSSFECALIGINANAYRSQLDALAKGLGLSGMIDAGSADQASLSRLARFISRSISQSSQSLAAGAQGSVQLSQAQLLIS